MNGKYIIINRKGKLKNRYFKSHDRLAYNISTAVIMTDVQCHDQHF